MQKVSLRRWRRSLPPAAGRLRRPRSATIELSYGCNLRCLHCFNPTHAASKQELARDEIFRVLEETAELGVLEVCFTGGEAFTRPDLFAILEKAGSLGFLLSIKTNATRLTPALARRLEGLAVGHVTSSIYGASREVYESVTAVPGSHARFLAGLDALGGTRLRTTMVMPVMTLNRAELGAARELARSRGLGFIASVEIYPGQDGSLAPLRYRLGPEEKLAVLRELGPLPRHDPSDCAAPAPFVDCSCGRSKFAVTAYGEMNLCTIFPIPRYDLRRGTVAEGWEVLKRTVDEARPNENYECPACELRSHCRQGRADSWLEKRDLSACLPHYKELARLEKGLGAVAGMNQRFAMTRQQADPINRSSAVTKDKA